MERQLLILKLPAAKLAIVNDLAVVKTLLTDHEGVFPKSSDLEMLLRPLIGRGVFGQPGGDAVKQMRRVYIRALSQIPEAEVARIARHFTRQYMAAWQQTQRPVPIPSELSRLAIDIVTQATLGNCFSVQESQRFVDLFFRYHKRANPLLLLLAPRQPAKRQALFDSFGLEAIGAEMRALIRHRFVDPLLDDKSDARLAPFASALLESTGPPNGCGLPLDRDEARQTAMLDEISVMLLAGHETTASVLSWLLWELADMPDEQDTLGQLLMREPALRQSEAVPADPDPRQNLAQRRLAALIQESLRLYPPIAFLLRETRRDVVFRERPIPADSFMVVSPWIIQRHRHLWQNPDVFDPGRWLAADASPATANRTAFIPFGQGPRVCPGKRFADVEMQAILTELLGGCRFSRVSGRLPEPLGSLTSRPDRDFKLRVTTPQ
jgi:cytochrome P450